MCFELVVVTSACNLQSNPPYSSPFIALTFQGLTYQSRTVIFAWYFLALRMCALYLVCVGQIYMCFCCSVWIVYVTSQGSSVSIVCDCGLDDRPNGVRSSAGTKDFSSNLCVQTDFGAHPASCAMVPGVLSPGAKRGRGVTLTTHPHIVPRSRMSRSYASSFPKCHHGR
jgi:hypothetical protein